MQDNLTNMWKNDLTYTNTQSSSQVHLLQHLCRITYLTGLCNQARTDQFF